MDSFQLRELYRGFRIETPVGNNAFSFQERRCRSIHVAPLIQGSAEDVTVGSEPAFIELVEGEERTCPGLRRFVQLDLHGRDVFIFDNHNHAFFFWFAAIASGVIPPGLPLVHVDQHRDMREPDMPSPEAGLSRSLRSADPERLSDAFRYTNFVLNVGNFIPPALKLGFFGEVTHVASAAAFDGDLPQRFVLDLDLDVFAPIMAYISDDFKLERLRAWIRRADFVTVATSPFFMDQPNAIRILSQLLRA